MADLLVNILNSSIRLTTPILLCGLGGLISLLTADLNIALEGMMLTGALFAVVGSYFLGGSLMGVVAGGLAGAALGYLFGLLVVRLKANPFIVGVTMNILCDGLTIFLLRLFFGVKGSFSDPSIQALPALRWETLEQVPVVGRVLSGHTLFVYVSWLLVIAAWVVIYRTRWGKYLRAAGEHPEALETAGISVARVRMYAQMACGVLCGLAGAHLALGYLTLFSEGMSAGRGFVGLAAVIFGGTNPVGLLGSSLLFGLAEGVSLRLQQSGVPPQFPLMLPYVVTLIALYVVARRRRVRLSS